MKPRKLIHIKPDEVSLVDHPANKRHFFVIKHTSHLKDKPKDSSSETGDLRVGDVQEAVMDEKIVELLKEFVGDKTDELVQKFTISEESSKAFQDALEVLKNYKADFPGEVVTAITDILSNCMVEKQEATETSEEDTTETEVSDEVISAEDLITKAFEKIEKEVFAGMELRINGQFEELLKALKALLGEMKVEVVKGEEETSETQETTSEETKDMISKEEAQVMVDQAVEAAVQETMEAVKEELGIKG